MAVAPDEQPSPVKYDLILYREGVIPDVDVETRPQEQALSHPGEARPLIDYPRSSPRRKFRQRRSQPRR